MSFIENFRKEESKKNAEKKLKQIQKDYAENLENEIEFGGFCD